MVDIVNGIADLNGKQLWIEGDGHPNAMYYRRIAELIEPEAERLLRANLAQRPGNRH